MQQRVDIKIGWYWIRKKSQMSTHWNESNGRVSERERDSVTSIDESVTWVNCTQAQIAGGQWIIVLKHSCLMMRIGVCIRDHFPFYVHQLKMRKKEEKYQQRTKIKDWRAIELIHLSNQQVAIEWTTETVSKKIK